MINCDNSRCEHNQSKICKLNNISIIDDLCVSRRRKPPDENYSSMMQTFNPNCRKDGRKYKSNNPKLW